MKTSFGFGGTNKGGMESVNRTIYMSTTGNDVTGIGSLASPFASLLRCLQDVKNSIDNEVTVTIHISAGTYDFDNYAIEQEFSRIKRFDNSFLVIEGEMELLTSGFTLSARSPEDFIYDVSGASFSANQYQDKFLLVGANYYPIAKNDATVLYSFPGVGTAVSIYQPSVIFNLANKFFDVTTTYSEGGGQAVIFKWLKFSLNDFLVMQLNSQATIQECTFNVVAMQMTTRGSVNFGLTRVNIVASNTAYGLQVDNTVFNSLRELMVRKTGTKGTGLAIQYGRYSNGVINGLYVLNYENGLGFDSGKIGFPFNASELIIDGCTNAFSFTNGIELYITRTTGNALYLLNVNYLVGKGSTYSVFGDNSMFITNMIGAPTTGYLTADIKSLGYVNKSRNISLIIPGIFPEGEDNKTGTFNDNGVSSIDVGDITQNVSVEIDYQLNRGAGYRNGKITIMYDGSTLTSNDGSFDNGNAEVSPANLALTGVLSGNTIRLQGTLNSTGNNAGIRYSIRRTMV